MHVAIGRSAANDLYTGSLPSLHQGIGRPVARVALHGPLAGEPVELGASQRKRRVLGYPRGAVSWSCSEMARTSVFSLHHAMQATDASCSPAKRFQRSRTDVGFLTATPSASASTNSEIQGACSPKSNLPSSSPAASSPAQDW